MIQDTTAEQIAEDRRKEIFLAIVEAQDREMGVPNPANWRWTALA